MSAMQKTQSLKSSIRLKSTAILVLVLTLMASNHLPAQTNDTVTINLKNADIRSLVETVSLQTGKNFIIDPRVKATVTVISSSPITKDELYRLFLSVLDVHGFATVPAGSMIKIVPTSVGVQSPVPVLAE